MIPWTLSAQKPQQGFSLGMLQDPSGLHATNTAPIPMDSVVSLEISSDLTNWGEFLRFQGDFKQELNSFNLPETAFFRLKALPVSPLHTWKNQAHFPMDPFRNKTVEEGNNPARWIKFTILVEDFPKVIFQDSSRFLFHYDFARLFLQEFKGLTPEEFNQVTLLPGPSQKAILGAVLFPPENRFSTQSGPQEIGIQFAGKSAFDIREVIQWFEAVSSSIYSPMPLTTFYMPAYEQIEEAVSHSKLLEEHGIRLSQVTRWSVTDLCYASGWAFGRLVYVNTPEIEHAYATGRINGEDILITDGVPAELPPLAGIISLTPSTPNSHVAILARSYGIPFVHLIDETDRNRALALNGREIFLSVNEVYGQCRVELFPVDSDQLDEDTRTILKEAQFPPHLDYVPKSHAGKWTQPTVELHPSDIRFFGGKASNFGILQRSIPNHSPELAIAFSFDLWDAFMAQEIIPGMVLKDFIMDRLEPFMHPNPMVAEMKLALKEVRDRIRDAEFNSELRGAILDSLSPFDPDLKIRFRSSTNLEDSQSFTGAGLYDSFSGCLQDDLDGDDAGPSHCDPTEKNERGVFRAIKRVYASFYNDNAFLERRRRAVVENETGMAVLAHYSFPDEMELANGVATISLFSSDNSSSLNGELVTQTGAVSVSNPEPGSVPEVVSVRQFGASSTFLTLDHPSSLLPLGDTVLRWDQEYKQLTSHIKTAGLAFLKEFPERSTVNLDLEYKKIAPGKLVIKQIREIPDPGNKEITDYILLDKPVNWTVHQGEHANLFATHRLKSFWKIQSGNGLLSNLQKGPNLYQSLEWTWKPGAEEEKVASAVTDLPGYQLTQAGEERLEGWTWKAGEESLKLHLITSIEDYRLNPGIPVATEDQFDIKWRVQYQTPRPEWHFTGMQSTRTDEVLLTPKIEVDATSLLQTREFDLGKRIQVQSSFYWPEPPSGPTAGYTAPLIAWRETRIQGLTQKEIVLNSPYSQTYVPGHHNFWETFLFEPGLESGLDSDILDELNQKNTKAILIEWDWDGAKAMILGLDDQLRNL